MSFLTYLISGLSLGSIYAIIALGYTMVYGIAKMLNFAHGDFIMVGCYTVFSVVSTSRRTVPFSIRSEPGRRVRTRCGWFRILPTGSGGSRSGA